MRTLFVVGILLSAGAAHAYVPPGGFILGKMADKRAALNLADIEAQAQTTWGQSSEPLDERLQWKRPSRFRWSRVEGEWAYVYRDGEAAYLDNGGATRKMIDFEPIVDVLLPKAQSAESIKSEYSALLGKLGIDTSTVSLQRFATGVSFMLGGKGGKDREKPSFWIDKDSLLPVRIIYKGEHEGQKGMWDVQFREFKDTMPRVIERFFDGKLVSRTELVNVSTHVRLPEGLFQLPPAKTK